MATEKKFTWADLKRIVNKIPAARLKDSVIIWEDERGATVTRVRILEEDYHEDGDTGTWPKSIMKSEIKGSTDYTADDFPRVFKKGTRIIEAE